MNDRQRLEAIVSVVGKYLPPNGMQIDDAMSEIIGLVDPLPPAQQEPVSWVTVKDGICVSTRSANFSHIPDGQCQLYVGPLQNDVVAAIATLKAIGYVYNESKTCKEGEQWVAPQPAPQAPAWWPAVENILNEYGLQAIDFVADFKEAFALSQQEPYCYVYKENGEDFFASLMGYVPDDATPLYTSPPTQRKPLSVPELEAMWNAQADHMNQWDELGLDEIVAFAQAAHGIKGDA